MKKKVTRDDMIKAYKGIIKSLYESLENEKKFGMEDGGMAKEIQKNIDEMESTLKKAL